MENNNKQDIVLFEEMASNAHIEEKDMGNCFAKP